MKRMNHLKAALVIMASLLSVMTGCIGYVSSPRHARAYPEPTVVYAQDDYIYYPNYQVYYSGRTRQYVYLDGRAWVTRPAPPRVSVDVLFASPSVSVGFHDAPSRHHSTVVQTYPKNWTPPGHGQGNNGNGNGNGHGR